VRVLLYSRVFPPAAGGMERFAEELAGWLDTQGHEVTVATATPAGALADRDRHYRVLRRLDVGALGRAFRWADVVHVNGLSLRGILSAVGSGRRPVVTHQGHHTVCPTGLAWSPAGPCGALARTGPCAACPERGVLARAKVAAHRLGASTACRNVTVSRFLERRLGLPRGRTIYNPVSPRAFGARAPGAGTSGLVAFAGRLVAEKGLDLLLRAIAGIPGVRLEVAGDGPLRPDSMRLCEELKISDRVRFLGAVPLEAVAEVYARAALVCVPSVWEEPFGYAAAEAMAMERPVLATRSGALTELLADGRGFLAPEATPQALAATLVGALSDDRRRAEVASRARAYAASELGFDTLGPTYVRVYEEARR
jgi:glycosyltransferase involved in cell wall biosynthesis